MGLGGHLMWTAVGRNVKTFCNKKSKILWMAGTPQNDKLIYKKNPNFYNCPSVKNPNRQKPCGEDGFLLDLKDCKYAYLEKSLSYRVTFLTEEHIIKHICHVAGLRSTHTGGKSSNVMELKCEIYLTEEEKAAAKAVRELHGLTDYICIEPHSKTDWTRAKSYSFEKYQRVVNSLKDKYRFVQVGTEMWGKRERARKLDNVTFLNGMLSFRETADIIKNSLLFISTEGGLVHLANAVSTKSIVIYTSYQNPSMTMYPENTLIDIALHRDELIGYKDHDLYKDEIKKHDESEIIEAVISALK